MLTSVILEQNVLQKWNILFCGLYKRQTSPNANVTKVTTVSVDIFMFFDTDFMFGIGRSSPRSIIPL